MNAKDVIDNLRTILLIEKVKRKTIEIEKLESCLDKLEALDHPIPNEGISLLIKEVEIENEFILENARAENTLNIEMFRSVFSSGQNALKAALVINAGASVSILAFISNTFNSLNAVQQEGIGMSLRLFSFGVLTCAVSSGLVYVVQYFYNGRSLKAGHFFNILTITMIILSYFLFALGVNHFSKLINV